MTKHTAHTLFIVLLLVSISCNKKDKAHAYQDLTHYSDVFKLDKYYRLYLPEGYHSAEKRFPVVYFFHGWGGRYKSDDNAKVEYEMIKSLVDKYQVILVMWDGNIEETEPRPYNIGNHPDVKYDVQMKDYFLELISHIDDTYKTIPEKNNRGIIGFSMGGFMSYFLAGKYPDKISAIKFKIQIETDDLTFIDEIIVPVMYDVPSFEMVAIDDGRPVNDTSGVFGVGNKDGMASPGENIMLYTNGHRLRLYLDDPFVDAANEKLVDEVIPAKWSDGFTLSSVIKISDKCPDGHVIEGVGSFETKGFMPIDRKLTWARFPLPLKNNEVFKNIN